MTTRLGVPPARGGFPRGRHVVLTDHVRLIHSGICRTLLTRSQALAEHFDVEIEILTVDRVQPPVDETAAELRDLGLIGARVRLVSMWDDLRAWGIEVEETDPVLRPDETTPGPVTVRGHRRGGRAETWPTIWSLYSYWLRRRYGRERVNCLVDLPELADFLATAPPRGWAVTYVNHADHRGHRKRWKRLTPKRGFLTLHLDQFDAASGIMVLELGQRENASPPVHPELRPGASGRAGRAGSAPRGHARPGGSGQAHRARDSSGPPRP